MWTLSATLWGMQRFYKQVCYILPDEQARWIALLDLVTCPIRLGVQDKEMEYYAAVVQKIRQYKAELLHEGFSRAKRVFENDLKG